MNVEDFTIVGAKGRGGGGRGRERKRSDNSAWTVAI